MEVSVASGDREDTVAECNASGPGAAAAKMLNRGEECAPSGPEAVGSACREGSPETVAAASPEYRAPAAPAQDPPGDPAPRRHSGGATVEEHRVPTAEQQQVPTGEEQQVPPAGQQQVPTAEEQQVPTTEEQQVPTAEEQQVPPAGQQQVPTAEKQQLPTAEEQQVPTTEEQQVPTAKEQQVPTAETQQIPAPPSPEQCCDGPDGGPAATPQPEQQREPAPPLRVPQETPAETEAHCNDPIEAGDAGMTLPEQRAPTPPRLVPKPPSPSNRRLAGRGSGSCSFGPALPEPPGEEEQAVGRQNSQQLFSRTWNRALGTDHREAVGYMTDTKGEMEIIMECVDEIYNEQATDAIECCFSDVKRIVAVKAGEEVFDQIDANKDGKLSVEEVNHYFARNPALQEQLSSLNADQFKADWLQMLDMLDEDGNQRVDLQEFTDFWTSNSLGDYADACRLFQKMDASNDGQLSTAEVKRYLKKDEDLTARLAEARCKRLLKEWDSFFDMMKDGTDGECDKAQFASLWAASGLGLKMARNAEGAHPSAQGQSSPDRRRPLTTQMSEPARAKSPLQPRPPSSSRSRAVRPLHTYEPADPDTYLLHSTACLERPCVAKKVNYHDILAGQQTALCERNASLESYNEMLRKMEEYQAVALRVLDAHYNALTRCSQIRAENESELPAGQGSAMLPPIVAHQHQQAVECT
ncbi:Calcium-binding protein [Diplonema papillatum]|nr:Calcium-binding protein [Diplonema papillatum]